MSSQAVQVYPGFEPFTFSVIALCFFDAAGIRADQMVIG